MSVVEILGENLDRLMKARANLSTAPSVEAATLKAGKKVGRTTVQRMRNKDTPATIENVEAVAQAFGLDAWQLLTPDLSVDGRGKVTKIMNAQGKAWPFKSLKIDDFESVPSEELEKLEKTIQFHLDLLGGSDDQTEHRATR